MIARQPTTGRPVVADVLERIVVKRRTRIEAEGAALGVRMPEKRRVPLVPFVRDPLLIAEIKKRSPSRGPLAVSLDPVEQAGRYTGLGCTALSVLTEEDHFSGSLMDLIAVKERHPEAAVLRKDFLLSEEDIELSYRAGADAALIIASVLSSDEIGNMLDACKRLGLAALVEVHTPEEIDHIRPFQPPLVGINARNLHTFYVDKTIPIRLRSLVDWHATLVFESGIFTFEDAYLAGSNHFAGILVGEAVMKEPTIIPELAAGLAAGREAAGEDFWYRLYARRNTTDNKRAGETDRPLVKICGIARVEDGRAAADLGADLLGFIFADSPRRVDPAVVRELADLPIPKVAVVVDEIPDDLAALLREGLVDAVQFHGAETPDTCFAMARPYYKAFRPKNPAEACRVAEYASPRVLIDAFSPDLAGGTGVRVNADIVRAAAKEKPLWIAGGLDPDNVAEVIANYRPELVDASSRLESEPGKKSVEKLKTYFGEINRASALR